MLSENLKVYELVTYIGRSAEIADVCDGFSATIDCTGYTNLFLADTPFLCSFTSLMGLMGHNEGLALGMITLE